MYNQDPSMQCSGLSSYGAPIQMQPNYYGNAYGSPYGQAYSSQICTPGSYQWPPQSANNQQTPQQNQANSNQHQHQHTPQPQSQLQRN